MRDFRERCYKLKMDLLTATPERWNAHLKQMKMAGKGDDLPEIEYSDLKAFVRREDWRLSVSTTQHVHEELQLIEKIVPIFFWRNWIILKSAPGKETFVTADHPVTLLWSDPKMQGFPAGFGMEGTEVLFPLSKDLALVGVFNSSTTELQVNNRIVAAFNGSTILNAERQIYAKDGEFSYLLRGNGTLKRGRELLNDRIFLARNHTS